MSFVLGVAASLAAPFVMVIGFIVWDNQWKGSAFGLNLFKCTLASIGFLVLSLTTRSKDNLFPSEVFTQTSVGYLMLSATIGILLGDWIWLEGLRLIGARRVIVIDSCKPFLAALFGWVILGEQLKPAAFGGMALTVTGVLIVSLETEKEESPEESEETAEMEIEERLEGGAVIHGPLLNNDERVGANVAEDESVTEETKQSDDPLDTTTDHEIIIDCGGIQKDPENDKFRQRILTPARSRQGYAMAFANVVLDTYGSLLTKEHGVGMTTWEINLIRFGFSAACMLVLSLIMHVRQFALLQKNKKKNAESEESSTPDEEDNNKKDNAETWFSLPLHSMTRMAWLKVSMGVALVTFLTPALSNYALFQIALALALTLGSVGPLYALPLTWLLQHDKPTLRACLGGMLAVSGIVVLSIVGKEQ
jgi:drug/metabolite transporter (DMT)-like permease